MFTTWERNSPSGRGSHGLDLVRVAPFQLQLEAYQLIPRQERAVNIGEVVQAGGELDLAEPGESRAGPDSAWIDSGAALLSGVLMNRLSNAVTYAPDGGEVRCQLYGE